MSTKIDLQGQVAYITGGSRGIGLACARKLAEAGAHVAICSRTNNEANQKLAEDISSNFNVESLAIACDVGNADEVKSAFKLVQKTFGRLDVFVNNAGIMETGLLPMTSAAAIRSTMDTNVTGSLLNLQMAAKLMSRKGRGSIINLSSIVGRYGAEGQVAYSTSKAAIIGMTSAAAKELAPQGIRVNAVAPGFIDTDLLSDFDQQQRDDVITSIKLGRMGQAEEVANSVLFLASDMASYVTGETLGVDGGMVI